MSEKNSGSIDFTQRELAAFHDVEFNAACVRSNIRQRLMKGARIQPGELTINLDALEQRAQWATIPANKEKVAVDLKYRRDRMAEARWAKADTGSGWVSAFIDTIAVDIAVWIASGYEWAKKAIERAEQRAHHRASERIKAADPTTSDSGSFSL